MSNWKDKQNIGNLLKRVTEGLSEFETTWEKAHNAPSTNLKNKYEMELKKEIKKLQRYREQIKSWCQTNDVSSYKASLEESRSLIEREMERFQTFEKESKTKQYTKKALAKLMKKEKEDPRDETYKWIKEIQRRLTEQLEEFEEQMDTIGLKGKRGSKASKRQFDELHEKVKQHNWHIEQLEITSKRLKGGEITIKKVAKIREDVEYYVDSNQDPDFVLYEYLFDALDEDDSEDEDKENSEESRRESAEKGKAETALTEKPPQLAGSSTGAGGGSTATIHYRQQDYSVHVTNSPKSQKLKVRPKNDILKRKQNRERNSRELTRPSLKRPNEESPTTALTGNIHSAWGHKSMEKLSTPSHPNEQGAPKVFSPPAGQKSPGQDVAGWTPVMNRLQNSTNEATLDLKPIPGDKKLHPGSLTMPPENLSYMTSNRAYNSPISAKNFVSPRNYESFGRKERMNGVSTRSNDNGTRDDIGIDCHYKDKLRLLKTSMECIPNVNDTDRPRVYIPRNPYRTPESFPKIPPSIFDDAKTFTKFSTDTLFFIFYFAQGTQHQYYAARELKRLSWRYHKKYLTWFQRHDTPLMTTELYERGSYVYFDYENGWGERVKQDFTFEYKDLEDELRV